MNQYKVFVNGKTFLETATSAELNDTFGISPLKAKNMANEHRPENIEIRLEKIGEVEKPLKLSMATRFVQRFEKEAYEEWVEMNKRYGGKVNV